MFFRFLHNFHLGKLLWIIWLDSNQLIDMEEPPTTLNIK